MMQSPPFSPLRQGLSLLALCGGLAASPAVAAEPVCPVSHPVRFGGMSWESNLILVEIEREILEQGFGCRTRVEPGEALTILAGAQHGDVDVVAEVWQNAVREAWDKIVAGGRVKPVGTVYKGFEAWYVPAYTARSLPGLRKVSDLPRFRRAFADPEDPAHGRFIGCPPGWGCDQTARNLFRAFGLEGHFNYVSPGSGAAQKAVIQSAYRRRQNLVFYYWGPTPLVSRLALVQLDMGAYDPARFDCIGRRDCASPQPTAYPESPVLTAVNADFARRAPAIAEFLARVHLPTHALEAVLAWAETRRAGNREAARHFLQRYPLIWQGWLDEASGQRLKARWAPVRQEGTS